jgi:hypothetical protein
MRSGGNTEKELQQKRMQKIDLTQQRCLTILAPLITAAYAGE